MLKIIYSAWIEHNIVLRWRGFIFIVSSGLVQAIIEGSTTIAVEKNTLNFLKL